jgi:site-specific recombinase XerD
LGKKIKKRSKLKIPSPVTSPIFFIFVKKSIMPNAKFILKEPKSKDNTLIYLFYRYKNNVFKYSFDQKINPKFWNFEKQRAKETRQFPEYSEFNSLLNKYESTINNTFRKLLNDGKKITNNELKKELDEISNINLNSANLNFVNFAENLIKTSIKKANTIKHYKQTLRQLIEYQAYEKYILNFEDINLDFYNEFLKFLNEKKYSSNTIGGYIKNIKVFMNEAFDRKLTSNLDFRNKKFKTIEVESESIYLSQKEISKIYIKIFSKNPKLDKARDIFIIACYTGLRFSDLKQINNDNLIKNNTQLKVKTEKTGEMVIIPLHPFIKAIIKKYNGNIPQIISNQKMNEYIKEIGESAGIKEKVTISALQGGNTISTNFNKFELITVHTARRSFATNAYLAGVPTISIMKITGHRTERAFLKYIKISQEDNANKLLKHPFFK